MRQKRNTFDSDARSGPGRRRLIGVVACVVLFAVAGIAYAAIPGTDGIIHGCYQKTNGALRVIDPAARQACGSTEKSLDWNQVGQQGAAGPQGPAGPSDLWDSSKVGDLVGLPGGQTTTLASVSVPAGSYFVSASLWLYSGLAAEQFTCVLDHGPGLYIAESIAYTPAANRSTTLALQGVVTLTASATVNLDCFGTQTPSAASNWNLDAIKVGVVH